MEFLVIAFLLGLIPAYIAKSKGRDFLTWWVYGFLIFIVALPHSIIIKPDKRMIEEKELAQGMKKCPFCAEIIKDEAIKCRFCGSAVSQIATHSELAEQQEDMDTWTCVCGEKNVFDKSREIQNCPNCGTNRDYALSKKKEPAEKRDYHDQKKAMEEAEKEWLKMQLSELEKKEEKCLSYLTQADDENIRASWASELAYIRQEKKRIAALLSHGEHS